MSGPRGALMVCGTASDAGKSSVVAGLCRVLARRGVSVAPFKGQNMSLNSVVTAGGAEIGRAQYVQAIAAGVEPEAAMNPVLLKPTGERTSQVVVMGRPWRTLDAVAYQEAKAELSAVVLDALADLRSRFDVVLCEGAGSPAEVNLLDGDIVNLGLARRAGIPAVVVGDIDRGGVLAHLYGTVALLPPELAGSVRGFVVNKFRGDAALLGNALDVLAGLTGRPTFGVLPFLSGVALDAEDSLALATPDGGSDTGGTPGAGGPEGADGAPGAAPGEVLDVAVVRFPRMSNFTDFDPLRAEPDVAVRFVDRPSGLHHADLVVLPGTKTAVADLAWLRARGLSGALEAARLDPRPPVVLGVCGGYQMLGTEIRDPDGVEGGAPRAGGLGWLDVVTEMAPTKVTRRRYGVDPAGEAVSGYEIHHGRTAAGDAGARWFDLDGSDGSGGSDGSDTSEGVRDEAAGVYGTSLHGLFESDGFRGAFLEGVAARRGKQWRRSGVSFDGVRQARIGRLADACETHLDLDALWAVAAGAGAAPASGDGGAAGAALVTGAGAAAP